MARVLFTFATSLMFLVLPPFRSTAADEPSPACAPPAGSGGTPASVFDPEEPEEVTPPEARDPADDQDRLRPLDQSWSPFDADDDDEVQA